MARVKKEHKVKSQNVTTKSRETRGKPQDIVETEEHGDNSPQKSAEKPVSLHPLEFEEAVRDLLSVENENKKSYREKR